MLVLFCFLLTHQSWAETAHVKFYSQKVTVSYDKSIFLKHTIQASDENIKQFYFQIKQANYQAILKDLKQLKADLSLNDWFYYELIRNASNEIFNNEPVNYRQAFTWFMLLESGYDVILTYREPFELFVYTTTEVYERSTITLQNKEYVSMDNFLHRENSVSYCQFMPGLEKQAFNFSIELPKLKGDSLIKITKEFAFQGNDEKYIYSISRNFIEFMKGYPKLNNSAYFNVQLSAVTYQSLIPQLKKRVAGLPHEEAVRYLLAFVRLTFSPQFDDTNTPVDFHPMIAEETLYYDHGDCEGKSVMFYFLVKELVGVPMIALLYPNHINVAVRLEQPYGNAIEFNDALYTVCEPNVVGDFKEFDVPGSADRYKQARIMVIN